MGLRSWLSLCIVLATALLVACSSPGKSFTYKDLKISAGPSATPAQPGTTQSTELRFTLRNTWNQPIPDVTWELRNITDPMNVVVIDGDDLGDEVDIPAFGSVPITVPLGVLSAGSHTYEVVVDPGNVIPEQDETNNTSATLTVVVADQDIAFSGTPVVTLGSPASSTDFTIAFTLTNTLHAEAVSPGGDITVPFEITDDEDAVVTPVSPGSPLSAVVPGGTDTTPGTITVTLTMPATNSAGKFVYTITLWPDDDSDGDDGNLNNNTRTVTVTIPGSG